jgi:hypothetical protein
LSKRIGHVRCRTKKISPGHMHFPRVSETAAAVRGNDGGRWLKD